MRCFGLRGFWDFLFLRRGFFRGAMGAGAGRAETACAGWKREGGLAGLESVPARQGDLHLLRDLRVLGVDDDHVEEVGSERRKKGGSEGVEVVVEDVLDPVRPLPREAVAVRPGRALEIDRAEADPRLEAASLEVGLTGRGEEPDPPGHRLLEVGLAPADGLGPVAVMEDRVPAHGYPSPQRVPSSRDWRTVAGTASGTRKM